MLAARVPNSESESVFVELLDEGTRCIRPVPSVPMGGDRYRLLATTNYDPEDEHWSSSLEPSYVVEERLGMAGKSL